MADFYQNGPIATLHRLGDPDYELLESELSAIAKVRPLTLVLPCHARDLHAPALAGIIDELRAAQFINHVIVGLDGADATTFVQAKSIFSKLPYPASILWNDGPEISSLLRDLEGAGLDPGTMGKGRNLRLCIGHAISSTRPSAIAIHDCDIVNYRRQMLVRLAFPVMHPDMGFRVAKGYSARFSSRLDGRVMRLLLTPLLKAMETLPGFEESPGPLRFFRYPISGEVCLSPSIASALRFPSDWGVETGMMADLCRVCELERVCQVDIAESYDHKHQALSEANPFTGLNKMACDVALCLLRSLPSPLPKPEKSTLIDLLARYSDIATDLLRFYAADARINLLDYDRDHEKRTIQLFAESIRRAIELYAVEDQKSPPTPSWSDIESSIPGFGATLAKAVDRC